MMIAAVDVCNTLADLLTELREYIGPWPFDEYHHPMLTEDFFLQNPGIFLRAKPFEGAVQGMWRLKEHFDIVYLSARPKWAWVLTDLWLRAHGFPVGQLILTNNKDRVAKEIGVSIAIEDAPFEIDRYKEAGIPVIVKAQRYNKGYGSRFDWPHISEGRVASGL